MEGQMKTAIVQRSRLAGTVDISGAKNSSLRLLVASLLTDEPVILRNVSDILDVRIQKEMLEKVGKRVNVGKGVFTITEHGSLQDLRWESRTIRNTLLMLGALLARRGEGRVPLPGGCDIGERKYDLHEMAMRALGAEVWEEPGYLCAKSKGRLKGTDIHLTLRSTGATENSILMGTLATGTTTIWNPHVRPEILDLIAMLRSMGAKITVNGQESIVVEGVEKLHGCVHTCIPDNMEAVTFLIASAVTGGEVEIRNFPFDHLEVPLIHLRESGLRYFISQDRNSIVVRPSPIYPVEIATGSYPAINSDMQPFFAVYGLMARGESRIIDLRFPGQFQYVEELRKMGAECVVQGDMLRLRGGKKLKGTTVTALDLRTGAALLLAGLCADGETTITNFEQVERGYEKVIEKFSSLGAQISVLL